MDFFSSFYADPLYFIGVVLSVYAAFGFVYFLAGLLPGSHHVILIDGHDGHMSHYRHRIAVGLGLMVEAFIVWEIVRLIADALAGKPVTNGGLVAFVIVAYIIILILSKITGTKPPAGH